MFTSLKPRLNLTWTRLKVPSQVWPLILAPGRSHPDTWGSRVMKTYCQSGALRAEGNVSLSLGREHTQAWMSLPRICLELPHGAPEVTGRAYTLSLVLRLLGSHSTLRMSLLEGTSNTIYPSTDQSGRK